MKRRLRHFSADDDGPYEIPANCAIEAQQRMAILAKFLLMLLAQSWEIDRSE